MKMHTKMLLDTVDTGISLAGVTIGAAQIESILGIVLLSISILSLTLKGVFKIIQWYKKAKEDGKITSDEVKDVVGGVIDDVEKIKDEIENAKDKIDK